ncbi:YcxB family protein [Ensifer sp. BR816]|uniref:YcxB family protein n=1 Tax=Rhizobium sp. (strain BR816) TaxID=1057002 RepID=UPI00036FE6CE|nr:YcxB family protein [Ensifer sp. BR816]
MRDEGSTRRREPSAEQVDGSWHIAAYWSEVDRDKAAYATGSYYRARRRSWTFLKAVVRAWVIFLTFLCVVTAAFLVSGIVFELSAGLIADEFTSLYFVSLLASTTGLLFAAIPIVFKAYARSKPNGLVYPLTQIFGRDGVISEIPGWRSEVGWAYISDFIAQGGYFLLFHRAGYYIGVPRNAFKREDETLFEDFCRQAIASAAERPSLD